MSGPLQSGSSPAALETASDLHEPLATVCRAAARLVEQLQAGRLTQPETLPALWAEHIAAVQEVVYFLDSGGTSTPHQRRRPLMSLEQQREFGRLLRDRRNAARLSRLQLARKAQLSDSTIKFTETARHPPSRASLIRLINVPELRLRWTDVPGQPLLLSAVGAGNATAGDGTLAAAGGSLVVLDRMDFDELGDPVYVRRILSPRSSRGTAPKDGKEPPSQDLYEESYFLPLRRW